MTNNRLKSLIKAIKSLNCWAIRQIKCWTVTLSTNNYLILKKKAY